MDCIPKLSWENRRWSWDCGMIVKGERIKNLHHSMVHALCVTMQQYVTTDTLRYMVAISRPLMGIPEDKMQHMLSLQPVRGFVICRLQIKAGTSSKQVTTSNLKTCESLKLDLSPIKVTEMLMLEPEDEVQYLVYLKEKKRDHHIEILTKMKAELEELNNGSNKEQE
ncbi:hypothetical protein SYNPS1DRAFT_30547 [Syncephalis pseudoplumigaleata]|uniref:Uncharacterized protein n=1 Tax=Syncephalis pseudoplumigaleata TaxID=1712513 RepID=A0A4V1J137_9FUNG|nr:hypothetical protein SYNPS1DRAFT_30547 [Syncephalis pseudoplumigaleata]|eukprot:RKP23699.1 hypothetical protein SYNPS1DRAFT_30547 [Syncephalis pseudoplumigaleata]